MSFKKTLFFFLFFAFIGIYYYLIEIKQVEKRKEIEQEEKRVFAPIKKEEISEVRIEKENKAIRLIKINNNWKIKEPVEADVDQESLEIWLDYVAKLLKERIVLEAAENIKEFGLDKPFFSVQVKAADAGPITLLSGDEIPTGSMFYSKLKNKNTIFLIAAYNKNGIDKTAYELRDKSIFHFETDDVQGLQVSTKSGSYSVEKEDGSWQVVTPKKTPANIEKITSLLQKIRTTEIKKFVAEEAGDLVPYGLKEPNTKFTLIIGKDKAPHVLTLGKDSEEDEGIYAKIESKNKVFILKKEFLNEFPYSVNDIRDKSIIRFDKDNVNKIQFIFSDKTITTTRNQEKNWEIIEPKKVKADNFEINALLNAIKGSKVIDFIPEYTNNKKQKDVFALKNPRLTVKVFEKNVSEPKFISFGSDNQQGEAVYANTGSPDEFVLLEKEIFNKLNITEITLRNKYLLLIEEDKIARVQIEAEGKEYLLTYSKNNWALKKPEKKNLDVLKAKEILWSLGDIKFTDIVNENGKADLAAFGLEKPVIKVSLLDEKESNLESVFIGTKIKNKDLLYAMTDKSKTIYSIDLKFKDELINNLNNLLTPAAK